MYFYVVVNNYLVPYYIIMYPRTRVTIDIEVTPKPDGLLGPI